MICTNALVERSISRGPSARDFLVTQTVQALDSTEFPLITFDRGYEEGTFLTLEELISETDNFMLRLGSLVKEKKIKTAFFLDRSARPLADMAKQLFSPYFPEEILPAIRFINIGDRNDSPSISFTGNPDIVRKIYGRHIDQEEGIVVIDEYSKTFRTIENALEVLMEAFPETSVYPISAYTKSANWYLNSEFLGVAEYSIGDYIEICLQFINEKFKTEFKRGDSQSILYDRIGTENPEMGQIYRKLERDLIGTIPYTKRGDHTLPAQEYNYRYRRKGGYVQGPGLVTEEQNVFLQARRELDEICKLVLQKTGIPRRPYSTRELIPQNLQY